MCRKDSAVGRGKQSRHVTAKAMQGCRRLLGETSARAAIPFRIIKKNSKKLIKSFHCQKKINYDFCLNGKLSTVQAMQSPSQLFKAYFSESDELIRRFGTALIYLISVLIMLYFSKVS